MRSEQALFANEVFYLAFAQKDFAAMDNLWAREHPLVCVHPGWSVITAREDIMDSWEGILGNPGQPGIDFYEPRAHGYGGEIVMVTCYETLPNGVCVASNGFVMEDGEIRLFHHHAGQCVNPPEPSGHEVGPLQ